MTSSDRRADGAADVVAVLVAQHEQLPGMFEQTLALHGGERHEAFFRLRKFLSTHEAAEEQIVHPQTRRKLQNGDVIADDRLHEEEQAKQLLLDLEKLDVDSAEFVELFADLRSAVLAHAEQEELHEFPRMRERMSQGQLRRMARAVRLVEAVGPTRPHPGMELAAQNMLAGPFTTVLDRARDLVRRRH